MQNPPGMHQGKCLYIYKMLSTVKYVNLEKLGILEETKDVTEWVDSFVIMEKKTPDVSNSQSDRKLWICLDPRDLNEALEREPYYT